MIKLKIREQSIKYAKERRTKTSRREEEIEKVRNVLQELIEFSNKEDREKEEASRDLEEKHRHAKRARVIFLVIGSRSIRRTVHSNDLVKFFGGLRCAARRKTGNL